MNNINYRVDLTKSTTIWPLRLKIRRALWQIIFRPLFYVLPTSANLLRIILLRLMGANVGHTCLIEPMVKILMPWNLEMGNYVVLGRNVEIYNYAHVKISDMTVVSQRSYLCTGSHDYTHPHMPLIWKPIIIGSECWIASEVFIAPGVEIGNGTVIGARSVVTKSMPEWMVCAGNPCKPIKPRTIHEI
ncbi:MAG: WcaF family extracellular polysaccharide biosynthesis acetyltransferase [Rhodoferax sp.]|nr:WcaF family extracellular polysaccharide biosynthesis acetyltransferase [Rhodoferax sp.]